MQSYVRLVILNICCRWYTLLIIDFMVFEHVQVSDHGKRLNVLLCYLRPMNDPVKEMWKFWS